MCSSFLSIYKYSKVVINTCKYEFSKSNVIFIEHYINSTGISHIFSKVSSISNFPNFAITIRISYQFLEMINFYHKFFPTCQIKNVRNCDIISLTLHNQFLLKLNLMHWNCLMQWNCHILSQEKSCAWQLMFFSCCFVTKDLWKFSWKFSLTEARHSTFGQEFLVTYLATWYLYQLLKEHTFQIVIDYKPFLVSF